MTVDSKERTLRSRVLRGVSSAALLLVGLAAAAIVFDDIPIQPGDVCVGSGADAAPRRDCYQELREQGARRRLLTLAGVLLLIAATTAGVVVVQRHGKRDNARGASRTA